MPKRLFGSLFVAAMLLGASGASAQEFSNFYVFGDSLSDAGTYNLTTNNVTEPMKFTVNPYPVWDQVLGARYGIDVSPNLAIYVDQGTSEVLGGTNYAQGGACVQSGYNADCPIYKYNTLGEVQQVATYLASTGGKADPNALYSAWAGANDVFSEYLLNVEGSVTEEQALSNLQDYAELHVENIAALSAAGARYILVPNLPDIGLTPGATVFGAQAFLTEASQTYNATLDAELAALGGTNIIYVDIYDMLNEVIANPQVYGFSNVTEPACTTLWSLNCTSATLTSPDAATANLFADIVHPTPTGHVLLADYIASILAAPGQIALLAETPIYTARGIYRTLDTRTEGAIRQVEGFKLYGNVDYAPFDIDSTNSRDGFDGRSTGGYIGAEYGFDSGISAGMLLSISDGNYDFTNGGGFDSDMVAGSLYVAANLGSAYAQLSGTIGSIDYDSIKRQMTLGAATRTNSGSSGGTYYGTRLATGYDYRIGAATIGPIGQLTYQHATVDAYTETEDDATAMSFDNQDRELFYGTIGARASYDLEVAGVALSPNVQVSYNYDFLGQDRSVTAGLVGAPTVFSMPVYEPGRSWGNAALGARATITEAIAATITLGSQFGQSDVTNYYGNIGFVYSF